ncbi:MAG: cupin domain-containing protein [Abitibacteriaceae bacterium]|nr:cupin domain-containing protein [Abditibacteriaceae bacterium]MBV9868907.1 cupin domain-containing protein [Abditibacteriaceae bacterium]
MIHAATPADNAKGWFIGPWNSAVPIPVGYANEGINEKHYHAAIYEIYLIARGTSLAIVDGQAVPLQAGDMLVVEPQEVHTFTDSSPDYLHFVIQTPFIKGDKVILE